ncbi:hypothetical protein C5E07_11120 [Pseudoclavibacter sp. RFBJ3]|uniref:HNH endonuclease signature motif containing protein n=1 Tax=unclassified Pseudoclavibacter TaxID=2615177 RepID=UPI000CE73F55|nr:MULTISPECIES: HNH endonuclease signature motif containing protein [unclassified Pseudoclavibacter]PPF84013.1 hypothetical protein C5C12_10200 [Pseudoclavibacter sp. RFBJ5]PPF92293.1 hypothetical protein C5E07_11120 [Pseudoclavibacter sp. RFBJ3]PPF97156.1 hypothetical protein C5C19_14430 [Pseudoclavibacter sp. RFBH5]PPG23843.1 hypothetical protein C5E13_09815 [Pseudoclavibacter sp. RFBI4]
MYQAAAKFEERWHFDVNDSASVAAERATILSETARIESAKRAIDAEQILLEARAYNFGYLLDLAEGHPEMGMHVRSISAEISIEVQAKHGFVMRQLAGSWNAVREFPAAVDAVADGRISGRHLDAIVSSGLLVTHEVEAEQTALRARYVDLALREVSTQILTDAALKRLTARIAEELTRVPLAERRKVTRMKGFVSVTDSGDGHGVLHVGGSLLLLTAVRDRVRKQATLVLRARSRAQKAQATGEVPHGAADERTLGEVSADLICDQLLTSEPNSAPLASGVQAKVHLVIPTTTLLADERDPGHPPALLDGLTPVPLDEAKRLAANAPMFTRILTHPITGTVQAVDTYKPTAAMRRFLAARDVHCRFPGCRLPARGCHIDHTHEWQHGGATCTNNLEHLCVFHHVMRHATPWSVLQLEGGVLQWTTPSGKVLTDRPDRQGVRFVPSADAGSTRPPKATSEADARSRSAPAPGTETETETETDAGSGTGTGTGPDVERDSSARRERDAGTDPPPF